MADGVRSGVETVEVGVVEPRMLDHLEGRHDRLPIPRISPNS
jgi:hypothetical protein